MRLSVTRKLKGVALQTLMVIVLGCCATSAWAAQVPTSTQDIVAANQYEPLYLVVTLNAQDTKKIFPFLRGSDRSLYARLTDLQSWRLSEPQGEPAIYLGEAYYPLKLYPGVTYDLDYSKQTIALQIPAKFFTQSIVGSSELEQFRRPTPGGYVNYNVYGYMYQQQKQVNSQFDAGFFNRFGLGTSSFLLGNSSSSQGQSFFNSTTARRLLTSWAYDNPDKMITWTFGDASTRAVSWSSSVYFGGIQYGTNFCTQPSFLTYPIPAIRGEAVLPTAANLYVNGMLKTQADLPPGPYLMNNIPLVDGQGNISLVTTDILGRQQVVNVPYYNTANLLKQGLTDFSYEAGFTRKNYGIDSNDYSDLLVVGTERIGLTDKLTSENHAELMRKQQTVGTGVNYLLGTLGVVNIDGVVSHSNFQGNGALLLTGFQRRSEHYNFYLSSQTFTPKFIQLGSSPGTLAPRMINQISLGVPIGKNNFGVAYFNQLNRGQLNNQLFSATYARTFWHNIYATVAASRQTGVNKSNAFMVLFSLPLDARTSISSNVNQQGTVHQQSVELNRSLPSGTGYGYDVVASRGDNALQRFSLSAQSNYGYYVGTAAHTASGQSYTLNTSGGVVLLDGIHFTRTISNSFAVVEVPGYANVDVLANNGFAAKTNRKGTALVTNLPPYYNNAISIDMTNLPLNAQIDIARKVISTYPKSGYVVKFPVELSRSGTFTLNQESGQPLPEGAVIIRKVPNEQDKEFIVGSDGFVYVSDLHDTNQLTAYWEDKSCSFVINMPQAKAENTIEDLGVFVCKRGSGVDVSPPR